jgi:hypothetical protein
MEHVVFFPGPDGAPAFHRFASLDEAVRFVEHMRNVEGVVDVSVHQLTLVPLAFRAYYKVEVPGEANEMPATEMPAVPEQAPALEPMPVDGPTPVESGEVAPEPVELMPEGMEPVVAEAVEPEVEAAASANGKRSLGFFAH